MVRLLEDLTDLEKLALIEVSYSRLDTMYGKDWGCAAKYYYSYIIKEEKQFGTAATLGNIIHSVLENTLEANTPLDYDKLLEEYEIQKPIWDPDELVGPELYQAGMDIIAEFTEKHLNEMWNIYAKEMPFEIVVGRGLIRGYIDRVDIEGKRVTITDYKTGKKEVAAKHAPTDLQLGIYALAADKLFPDKEVYAQLYYLRSGRQKGHLFDRGDLDAIETKLNDLITNLINERDFRPTANERLCSYCDFNNGVCPIGTNRANKIRS